MQPCEGLFGRGKAKNVMLVIPVSVSPPASSVFSCALMSLSTFPSTSSSIFPSLLDPSLLQEFTTSGSNNTDTGRSGGHLETKYKMKDLGLTFNQKWNTDNTLTTEITLEDQVKSNRNFIYWGGGQNSIGVSTKNLRCV